MQDNKENNVEEKAEKLDTRDPAQVYNPSTRLPAKREMKVTRPGNINYAAPGGSYPGSRVIVVYDNGIQGLEVDDGMKLVEQANDEGPENAAEWANLYFKHRANLLTVAVTPTFDGGLVIMFTNHLEGERLEYFQKYQSVVSETMEKWEAEQQEKRAKEEEAANARVAETNALIELGRKARDHNLLAKLKELDGQVTKMKKLLKKNGIKVENE